MGSILAGLLGPALTTATQAVAGYEQGKAKAAQSELEAAMQRAQLQRQQQDFDLKKQIEARQAHSSALQDAMTQYRIDHPTIDPLSPQGIAARTQLDRGKIDYERTNGYHPAPASDVQFLVSQDAQGNPVYAVGDKRARTVTPTNAPAKPTPGGTGHGTDATHAMAGDHFARAQAASDALDKFGGTWASNSKLGNVIAGHNPFDSQVQQANQAGEEFATMFAPILNKGRSTHIEIEQVKRSYVPQIGDSPETIQQKSVARKQLLQQYAQYANGPSVSPASSSSTQRPSLEQRVQQLKAQGLSKDQARQQLQQEGYSF